MEFLMIAFLYFIIMCLSVILYRRIQLSQRLRLQVREHEKEQLRSDAELQKVQRQQQKEEEQRTRWVKSAAVELRTPMQAVMGYSELLLQSGSSEAQCNKLLSLNASVSSLTALMEDLVDISTGESTSVEQALVDEFCPQVLMDELTLPYRNMCEAKGVDFNLQLDSELPELLKGDSARIKRVLYNLLNNSLKYTDRGFVRLRLICSDISHAQCSLRFEIEDTGLCFGQDSASLKNQGQNASGYNLRHEDSSLVVSEKLIQVMGGSLNIISNSGQGTLFQVEVKDLPRIYSENASQELLTADKLIFSPAHILIIEDDLMNRELISNYLCEFGFALHFASDGRDAVKLARRIQPQIVLLDLSLPFMPALSTAAHLRDVCDASIIALAANNLDQVEHERLRTRCDDFLLRPLSQRRLLLCLMNFLKHEIREPQAEDQLQVDFSDVLLDSEAEEMSRLINRYLQQHLPKPGDMLSFNEMMKLSIEVGCVLDEFPSKLLQQWHQRFRSGLEHYDMESIETEIQQLQEQLHS